MSLYIFNNRQEVIKIVPYKRLVSVVQEQEINSKDELNIEIPNTDWLTLEEQPFYLAVRDVYKRYSFHMYKVIKDVTGTHTSQITGIQLGFDELKAHGYIKDRRFNGSDIRVAGEAIVDGTDWELGYVSSDLPTVNTNFYYITRLEALSKLLEVSGAEFQFRVEITGNKITAKRLDLYKQLSEDKGKRFVHGDKLLGITKESDNASLITALVGRGKGEETETGGYGRRLTFEDVEWGTDKPVVKPLGQEYVEIPEMTALYGYPDGSPRFGIAEFGDTEDAEELLEQTYTSLVDLARPQVQFKASVHSVGDMELGETVTIIRDEIGIRYKTRVFKVSRNLLNNNRTAVELGDKIGQSIGKTINKITTAIKDQREEVIEIVQVSANGKNKIYRGASEPTKGMMVGDLWYKPVNDGEVEMYQYNGQIWELIVSSAVNDEVAKLVEQARETAVNAREEADKSLKEINDAVAGSGFTSLDETIRNARDLAVQAQEDAQAIVDNKGEVLGLDKIDEAIEDIKNPNSNTWRELLSSDSGYIVSYTNENNDGVLTSASVNTASQITTALKDYTSTTGLDGEVTKLLTSESSQTAGALEDRLTSYVETDGLDGKVTELLQSSSSQTAGVISQTLSSYATDEDLGTVRTVVNETKSTAEGNTTLITEIDSNLENPNSTKFGRITSIETNLDGLSVLVGDPKRPDGGGLYTRFYIMQEGIQSIVEDTDGLKTTVGQMSDSWVLGIEDGEDLVTAINATRDGVYLKGDKIVLDGDTIVNGSFTVTDDIFVNGMNISKFTAGTLNGANVNIINLNVDNIVGNTSNFVQSNWNSISRNVGIDANGINVKRTNGSMSTIFDEDGIEMWLDGKVHGTMGVRSAIESSSLYPRKAVSLFATKDAYISLSYQGDNADMRGSVALSVLGDTGKVDIATELNLRDLVYVNRAIVFGSTPETVGGRLTSGLEGALNINSPSNLQLGIREKATDTSWVNKMIIGKDEVSMYADINMNAYGIKGLYNVSVVNSIGALRYNIDGGAGYITSSTTGGVILNAEKILSLYSGGNMLMDSGGSMLLQSVGKLGLSGSEVILHTGLNMNTYTIINQSDVRLKTDIKPASINAIREIEKLEFIDFKWDRKLRPEAPEEEQFGIKAQYAPFLQTKADSEDSYLSIDMGKQVNLNSKAIQEIITFLQEKLGGL